MRCLFVVAVWGFAAWLSSLLIALFWNYLVVTQFHPTFLQWMTMWQAFAVWLGLVGIGSFFRSSGKA